MAAPAHFGCTVLNTLGTKITVIYVAIVTLTLAAVFLLGRHLLATHLLNNVDRDLAARWADLKDRLTPDTDADDVQSILAAVNMSQSYSVQVEDLWSDPAYRAARSSGTPVTEDTGLAFSTETDASARVRRVTGVHQSLRVSVATPLLPVDEAIEAFTRVGLAITGATLALSVVVGHLLSRFALLPVRVIQETAARISSDNLSERIPHPTTNDEIGKLARLLNATFDRLESAFEQIKRFSSEASHEIKTPLAIVRLNVERMLLNEPLTESGRTAALDAIEQIDWLTRLVERLLFLSRAEAGEVALDRKLHRTDRFLLAFSHDAAALCEAHGLEFRVEPSEPFRAAFDEARIRQVLLNLLDNAIRASPKGSIIRVRSQIRARHWHVAMIDSGAGLPPAACERILERFVRLAPSSAERADKHAGLGLAICKSIVELHGGTITACPGAHSVGLEVSFSIPLRHESPAHKADLCDSNGD